MCADCAQLADRLAAMERRLAALEFPLEAGNLVRPEAILQAVCKKYGFSERELLAADRYADLIWPRHLAMYLCRRLTGYGWKRLGTFFRRDHGTLYYAFGSVKDQMEVNAARRAEVAEWMQLFAKP